MPARYLLALVALALPLTPTRAQVPQSEHAARREALAARVGDGVVVAFGAHEPKHDYLSFHQAPRFMYLTGITEPNAALVMVKRGAQVTSTLFVQPREPAREAWTGARIGTEGAMKLTGLAARPIEQLVGVLDSLASVLDERPVGAGGGSSGAGGEPQLYVLGDFDANSAGSSPEEELVSDLLERHPKLQVAALDQPVDQMRATKSAAEMALIRKAVEITARAQREAMQAVEDGINEFEIQALVEYTFRRNGADRPSFASIIGSGPNSTTLHYNANDRFMRAGETVVMDIGASYRGYAADVTRTVPVSGTFTPEQRAIYKVVRDAQAAAERAAKPGVPVQAMIQAAERELAAGLARLGLIESAEPGKPAMYDCGLGPGQGAQGQCPQIRLFYFHGLGHGIGLDVHDPGPYEVTGRLTPGSAFTIEPGLYVRADVLEHLPDTPRNRALIARLRPAVERYGNIGVRIEDDYLVSERDVEWISRAPREIEEIEALMRAPYAGPAKRDSTVVEWYRETGRP